MIVEVRMLSERVVARNNGREDGVEWPLDPARIHAALVGAASVMMEPGASLSPAATAFLDFFERKDFFPAIQYEKLQTIVKYNTFVPRFSNETSRNLSAAGEHAKAPEWPKFGEDDEVHPSPWHAPHVNEEIERLEGVLASPVMRLIYADTPSDEVLSAGRDIATYIAYLGASESPALLTIKDGNDEVSATGTAFRTLVRDADGDGEMLVGLPYPGRRAELDGVYADTLLKSYSRPQPCPPEMVPYVARDTRVAELAEFGEMVPLALLDDHYIDLPHAHEFVAALRSAFLDRIKKTRYASESALSGHGDDGRQFKGSHVAFVPLADVGYAYSSGRMRGVAIVFPRSIDPDVLKVGRACWLSISTVDLPLRGSLTVGPTVLLDDEFMALKTGRYARSETTWRSATPVRFNVFPRGNGERSVTSILKRMFENAGVTTPIESAAISRTPIVPGTARAMDPDSWHVEVTFSAPIRGPVLVGKGRYRGLGLMLPKAQRA